MKRREEPEVTPRRLGVYVPTSHHVRVAPMSAIVADDCSVPGERLIYFEGDIYGNGMRYIRRLIHAADRLMQSYPTVARMFVPEERLALVGFFYPDTLTLEVVDEATLKTWLEIAPHDAIPREELVDVDEESKRLYKEALAKAKGRRR